MSKQARIDAVPHIKSIAAAVRAPDQPKVTFQALDVAMKAVIGHKLLTVLISGIGDAQLSRESSRV